MNMFGSSFVSVLSPLIDLLCTSLAWPFDTHSISSICYKNLVLNTKQINMGLFGIRLVLKFVPSR